MTLALFGPKDYVKWSDLHVHPSRADYETNDKQR